MIQLFVGILTFIFNPPNPLFLVTYPNSIQNFVERYFKSKGIGGLRENTLARRRIHA
jgi:hypothetical protein